MRSRTKKGADVTVTTLLVERDRYRLEDDVDVDALKNELVDAVRSGGGFVRVQAINQPDTVLLVTPRTAVRIESYARDEYSEEERSTEILWAGIDESAFP